MTHLKVAFSLLLKYFLTVVALILSFAIGAAVSIHPTSNETASANNDKTFLLVALLNALIFSYWLYRSEMRGLTLLLYCFLVYFGVNTFMPQIETWFFGDAEGFQDIQKWGIVQMGLISALLFCPLVLLIWRKLTKGVVFNAPKWSISYKTWLGLALFYVIIYFVFGYFIAWQSPEVRIFYTGQQELLPFFRHFQDLLTTNFWIFPFQMLRGIIWVGLGYLIIQVLNKSRLENVLVVALIFSIPATFLWLPNPYMPEPVRMVHFVETFSSNFIYGLILGWALSRQ